MRLRDLFLLSSVVVVIGASMLYPAGADAVAVDAFKFNDPESSLRYRPVFPS